LIAAEESDDFSKSITAASNKLLRQLKTLKSKRKSRIK
jgi:ribosome-associated translation inhibitor RaiA